MKTIRQFSFITMLLISSISMKTQAQTDKKPSKETKEKAIEIYEDNFSENTFPKAYEKTMIDILISFENKKVLNKTENQDDTEVRIAENKNINREKERWIKYQNRFARKTEKMWRKKTENCNSLKNKLKVYFTDYHFYVLLETLEQKYEEEKIVIQRNKLAKKKKIKNLITSLVKCDTEFALSKFKTFKGKDSIFKKDVEKKLDSVYSKILNQRLETFQSLVDSYTEINTRKYVNTLLENSEVEFKKRQKQELKTAFKVRAKKVGLDDERIEKLMFLINKKEKDLKKFREEGETSDFLGANTEITSGKIKRNFSEKLSNLITKKEFAFILGKNLKYLAKEESEITLETIFELYELEDEQKEELTNLVYTFAYNKAINNAYYLYDKRLKRQKSSALRYRFEKDYRELMEDFGLKVKTNRKEVHSRTFQW